MSRQLKLEVFTHPGSALVAGWENRTSGQADPTESAAYELGYAAGWDDAARAAADEQERIGAEFARNLQDLGFTFHEARSHVIRSVMPLLDTFVKALLPVAVSETMGPRIIQELCALAESAGDVPIQIRVSPDSKPALEPYLAQNSNLPFTLVAEPSLAQGQVQLRSEKLERWIDMDAAAETIREAISAIKTSNSEEFSHG